MSVDLPRFERLLIEFGFSDTQIVELCEMMKEVILNTSEEKLYYFLCELLSKANQVTEEKYLRSTDEIFTEARRANANMKQLMSKASDIAHIMVKINAEVSATCQALGIYQTVLKACLRWASVKNNGDMRRIPYETIRIMVELHPEAAGRLLASMDDDEFTLNLSRLTGASGSSSSML